MKPRRVETKNHKYMGSNYFSPTSIETKEDARCKNYDSFRFSVVACAGLVTRYMLFMELFF